MVRTIRSSVSRRSDTAGMPVDDIAQHIEGVLGFQVDLAHDRGKTALIAVDIRKYVDHLPNFLSAARLWEVARVRRVRTRALPSMARSFRSLSPSF